MDDGDLPHGGVAMGGPSDNAMDLDLVDELLLGGCWLETTDGSEFFQNNGPSTSGAFFDSSPPFPWPLLDSNNNTKSISNQSQWSTREPKESSDLTDYSTIFDSQLGALVNNKATSHGTSLVANPHQFGNLFNDCSELNKIFWIGPQANPGPFSSVTKRLLTALDYIRYSSKDRDVLIQIWVPVNREGTQVLTTINQPFTLDSGCSRLLSYRNISQNYHFAAEENSEVRLGLPGRVFVDKIPDWTPDVRFFRADEYPRVVHAQACDIRGTLALPVFEQGSQSCLGVIEVVLTTQKVNYRSEIENVCRALQAVDLQSSAVPCSPNAKVFNNPYQSALPEIVEVLKSACESHGLPLAQTWVPCIQQGKEGCRHSDKNLIHCVSTIDVACVIHDPNIRGFHEACSDHHLLKGQGVAGKAFLKNLPCFCPDITNYGQTEYPLSHHARMFRICAAVAIRLRSIYTGTADFVLEFFLPLDCREPDDQRKMLNSLSTIIQRVSRTLRVVTEEELEKEYMDTSMVMVSEDSHGGEKTIKSEYTTLSCSSFPEELAGGVSIKENGGVVPRFKELTEMSNAIAPEMKQYREKECSSSKGNACNDSGSNPGGVGSESGTLSGLVKSGERKRIKSDKVITLEVLRQHFAGSLKDAAKSIGVCPTTLKRICRQHGIKRWPSRKIKKVGHSLQKLQVVIDSVQGASGSLQIGSFYSNFPDLASPANITKADPFSPSRSHVSPASPSTQEPGGGNVSPHSAASKSLSSSCSQSSSSSQCYYSGSQNQLAMQNIVFGGSDDSSGAKKLDDGSLKRVRSEAELNPSDQEATKVISRSQSQKMLVNYPTVEKHSPWPKHIGEQVVDAVQEGNGCWRVKVAYGEEKIRFRLGKGWGFKELEQEVMKRFKIGDMSEFHLKYLDDDSEWVLLTCDDDLEECIDVCRSTQRQTIRLCLQILQNQPRSSVGSNSLLLHTR